jgi:metal-responsive CopG/Arc/MetJ family transcriptional regulator
MKTAISLPDELFERAERHARQVGKSRSQLFSDALRDYLARHAPEEVTDAMNRVVEDLGEQDEGFRRAASRRTLKRVDW